jgi:hypothetical protein
VHKASGSSGELIYVTTRNGVLMVSYPQGKIVGTIPWYFAEGLICSDPTNGNVFIPEGGTIYEYAHGGTTPVATIGLPTNFSTTSGCAVDPTTGNLAMIAGTVRKSNSTTALLVYSQAQGTPTIYFINKLPFLRYPAYDDAGNLFLAATAKEGAFAIGELPAGKNAFTIIKLTEKNVFAWKIQWDGAYLAFESSSSSGMTVVQVKIQGKTGTIVNTTQLAQARNPTTNFWIQDGSIFTPYQKIKQNNNQAIGAWSYPSGGNPTAVFYGMTKGRKDSMGDLTVSVNPSH